MESSLVKRFERLAIHPYKTWKCSPLVAILQCWIYMIFQYDWSVFSTQCSIQFLQMLNLCLFQIFDRASHEICFITVCRIEHYRIGNIRDLHLEHNPTWPRRVGCICYGLVEPNYKLYAKLYTQNILSSKFKKHHVTVEYPSERTWIAIKPHEYSIIAVIFKYFSEKFNRNNNIWFSQG